MLRIAKNNIETLFCSCQRNVQGIRIFISTSEVRLTLMTGNHYPSGSGFRGCQFFSILHCTEFQRQEVTKSVF